MHFSVIIPVYNVEDYLEECIDSVLGQRDVDLEILLVDDGSTDNSGQICDAYACRSACIQVYHQPNRGLSESRNAGIRHAGGDYLLFIDGDDFIKENSLPKIKRDIAAAGFPDVMFLECMKVICSSDGRVKRRVPMMDGITAQVNGYNHNQLAEYIAHLPKYPASACTKAVKRSFLLEKQLFFKKGLYHEDLEWSARLFLSMGCAGYCGQDYYQYRQGRKGSISSALSAKHAADKMRIAQKWTRELTQHRQKEEKLLLMSMIEYLFRFLLAEQYMIPVRYRRNYRGKIRKCSMLLGIRRDRTSRIIRAVYRRCGVRMTGMLLWIYLELHMCISKAELGRRIMLHAKADQSLIEQIFEKILYTFLYFVLY